ncbi:hypothetical protein [Spirulina major]|uniref:hypothetical protein n=1 Tax=Spirulina major TaxID=270636 RepID=UPI000934712B|nr:hypothetical protein [Spirulina major]
MVPKILNRRFALVASLAVLGAVTFAPKASAVTVDVIFQGTIAPTCNFGTPTLPAANVLTATGDTFNTTAPGTVDLTCNSAASTLAIAAPVAANAAATALGAATASSSQVTGTNVNSGTAITNAAGAVAIGQVITNETLSVEMTWQDDVAIPAGTYQFSVTLTAVAL